MYFLFCHVGHIRSLTIFVVVVLYIEIHANFILFLSTVYLFYAQFRHIVPFTTLDSCQFVMNKTSFQFEHIYISHNFS